MSLQVVAFIESRRLPRHIQRRNGQKVVRARMAELRRSKIQRVALPPLAGRSFTGLSGAEGKGRV